jgi:ankyrin repeat protein
MELLEAINSRDIDQINLQLLDPNVDVNAADNFGITPLLMTAGWGNVDLGQRLINMGANINQTDDLDDTPLLVAVRSKRKAFVVMLLEQDGIDVNVQARSLDDAVSPGETPLTQALGQDPIDIELVEMLMGSGADPNIPNGYWSPLDLSPVDMIDRFIEAGADINGVNPQGLTPLRVAVGEIDLQRVAKLLSIRGIDIDLADSDGHTPLMEAARLGDRNTMANITLLLAVGADPLLRDNEGRTARSLVPAANVQIARLLEDAERTWIANDSKSQADLKQKFLIAHRLRKESLPQRELTDGIIRKSEYDNLCMGLQNNLNKPGVIALAKSLNLKTSNKTKIQLCNEISQLLTI